MVPDIPNDFRPLPGDHRDPDTSGTDVGYRPLVKPTAAGWTVRSSTVGVSETGPVVYPRKDWV